MTDLSGSREQELRQRVTELEAENKKLLGALHHATQKTHITNPKICSGCEAIYLCLGLKVPT